MQSEKSENPSVLFVCLGNICRSPLGEAALRRHAANRGIKMVIDSAGTGGWHVGQAPDPGSQAVAKAHGADISRQRARQVKPEDFQRFDYIIAMDQQNLSDLQAMMPADACAEMILLLDHHPDDQCQDVPDPYGGDDSAFAEVWQLVDVATARICAHIQKTYQHRSV